MSVAPTPLVSIIILQYNGSEQTLNLLHSIKKFNSYPSLEIIVVDNASDKKQEELKDLFPEVLVERLHVNRGYSAGNNHGILKAKGDFLFILNYDTEFIGDIVGSLLNVFEKYEDAAIVCPMIYAHVNPNVIEYAGYTPMNRFTGRNTMIGFGKKDRGNYQTIMPTAYAHGAAMMVNKIAITEVGLLPEAYFMYYEEIDWSVKMKNAGYAVYVNPVVKILHKRNHEKRTDETRFYHLLNNRILFMKRNQDAFSYFCFSLYFLLIVFPKKALFTLVQRDFRRLSTIFRIVYHNFFYDTAQH